MGLCRTVPEEPPGEAALQGTRCHELAESILKDWVKNGRKIDDALIDMKRSRYVDTKDPETDGTCGLCHDLCELVHCDY